jgi:hypothetical protein
MRALEGRGLSQRIKMPGHESRAGIIREACRNHTFACAQHCRAGWWDRGRAPVSLIEMAASGMFIIISRRCEYEGAADSKPRP